MAAPILQPGRNVWRTEHAARAAVLIDGAAFFGALRRAFLKAQRSIFIVGWDIDSRTRLTGESPDPDDGYSPFLGELLSELVRTRPELHVYILLWDYSVVYAAEREPFPRLALNWNTPERVTLCMDNALPVGSSQHQKLMIVDDALAFSGGLDVTQHRWDTHEHRADNPDRVDTSGKAYAPFHDVQMMVDGDAALALAELARRRWCHADQREPPTVPVGDPWPDGVAPDFTDVMIGIARTQPPYGGQGAIREVETLFHDAIGTAESVIYIENQFLTSIEVADRIAKRLRERPKLEVLAVAPRDYGAALVTATLGDERLRFMERLKGAGGERVRVMYPAVETQAEPTDTMVHSKVLIIDDRVLRVGSANLNNRSMGADTECDLVIEATSDAERARIATMRNRLIADHLGSSADAVAEAWQRLGSLCAVADQLSSRGHALRPIEGGRAQQSAVAEVIKPLLDPKRPLNAARLLRPLRAVLPKRLALLTFAFAVAVIAALTLLWHTDVAADYISGERVRGTMAALAASPAAPVWIVGIYLIAGVVAFPVTILIVATATIFGPWLGFAYATAGVLASATAMYSVGALAGGRVARRLAGSRWQRLREAVEARGVVAVAAVRCVPLAPFTVVNVAAGACSIRLFDFLAGTLIGMLPGLVAISVLGGQITSLLKDPSIGSVAVLVGCFIGWLGLAWAVQRLATRHRSRKR